MSKKKRAAAALNGEPIPPWPATSGIGGKKMKYRSGHFGQYPRRLFENKGNPSIFAELTLSATKLLWELIELEHQFTDKPGKKGKVDWFFRSNEELRKDTGLSLRTIKRGKAELKAKGIIKTWQMHWQDPKTEKLSVKHVTAFKFLI